MCVCFHTRPAPLDPTCLMPQREVGVGEPRLSRQVEPLPGSALLSIPTSRSLNGEMVLFNDPGEKETRPACQSLAVHAKSRASREES